jgi:FkbM family methyltransferase
MLPESIRQKIKGWISPRVDSRDLQHDSAAEMDADKDALTVDKIADIIRSYEPENATLTVLTADDFEMDCKIEYVDHYFNLIHDYDYLIFKHFTDPNETFLDIGANAGYSTTSMWASGGGLGVISFEPIGVYETMLMKIKKKAPSPYDYRMCGLSDKLGDCNFYTPVCNNIGLSAYTCIDINSLKQNADQFAMSCYQHITYTYKEKIVRFGIYKFTSQISTLDTILSEGKFTARTDNIAAMKIDTEGHELYVLRGALATIDRHHPLIMIEHYSDDVDDILKGKGYLQVYRHGEIVSQYSHCKDNIYNYFYISVDKINYYKDIGLYVESEPEHDTSTIMQKDEDYESVACTLCNASAYDEIYPKYIVKCRRCGLIYVRKRLREATVKQFYQHEYDKVARKSAYTGVATPVTRDEIDTILPLKEAHLNNILKYLPFSEPGLFLEIGCAWGSVLMAAQKAGYQTLGFELSADNVAFANQHGLNVTDRPFLDERIPPDSVDCVYICHVFEHLYQPIKTLKKIQEILKPGGICYCNVPNFDCYWHELTGRDWPWLDEKSHLYHFTAQTLPSLFIKEKFDILEVASLSSRDFSAGPLQAYSAEYPSKSPELLLHETAQFAKTMRGESLVVIAQKAAR